MKYNIQKLFNRGYTATVKRGCITNKTKPIDFINKLKEELKEVEESTDNYSDHILEVGDIIETAKNYLMYLCEDPIKIIEKVVIKNEKRAKGLKPDKYHRFRNFTFIN